MTEDLEHFTSCVQISLVVVSDSINVGFACCYECWPPLHRPTLKSMSVIRVHVKCDYVVIHMLVIQVVYIAAEF